jgi:hypothetical protein
MARRTVCLHAAVSLLAASLLLAGCTTQLPSSPEEKTVPTQAHTDTGQPPAPPSADPKTQTHPFPTPNGTRPQQTFTKDGSIAAGAGVPATSAGVPPRWLEVLATKCLEVDVEANATAMVAELTWKDPAQQLTLHVLSSDGNTAYFVSGNTLSKPPLRLQFSTPLAGGWNVCAQANGANADVAYTLYGTVFYESVPADFTAIPSSR